MGASPSSTSLYKAEFFDGHRDGSRRSAAIAVPVLVELFQPRSVVDVGCGTGTWLSVFCEHGVTDILGVDGPWVEERQREIPDVFFREYDLTQPVALERTFDLALCLEVAEHLPAEAGPALIASLTALAPVVVFSAAIPGQGGEGHINERWPSFWSRYFAAHGYLCFTGLRERLWPSDAVEFWYRQNMLCFVAETRHDLIDRVSRVNEGPAAGPLGSCPPIVPSSLWRLGMAKSRRREAGPGNSGDQDQALRIQEFESVALISVDVPHGRGRQASELAFLDWHSQQGRTE